MAGRCRLEAAPSKSCLGGGHQVAVGALGLAVPVGGLDDEQAGAAAEFGQHRIGGSVTGVGESVLACLDADAGVGHGMGQRHARQLERPCPVGGGQRVQVEDRGQVRVRFQSCEAVEYARGQCNGSRGSAAAP